MKIILSMLVFMVALSVVAVAEEQMTVTLAEVGTPAEESGTIQPDSNVGGVSTYWLDGLRNNVKLLFNFKAEDKARIRMEIVKEKLGEYQEMVNKGKDDLAAKVKNQIDVQQDKVAALLNKAKTQEKKDKIIAQILKHRAVMEKVLSQVPEQAKAKIQEVLDSNKKITSDFINKMPAEEQQRIMALNNKTKILVVDKEEVKEGVVELKREDISKIKSYTGDEK